MVASILAVAMPLARLFAAVIGDCMQAHMAEHIMILRNVNEHWDEPGGPSSVKFSTAGRG